MFSAPAQAQWYVEGSLGTILRQGSDRITTLTDSSGNTGRGIMTENFEPGLTSNLAIGFKFEKGMRLATEFGYSRYGISNVKLQTIDGRLPPLNGQSFGRQWGGVIDDVSASMNLFYDLPVSTGFIPYLGAGAGAVYTTSPDGRFLNYGLPGIFTDQGSSTLLRPMILAEAGINIAFSTHWAAVPSYRFQHVFTRDGGFAFDASILRMGVRYTW